MLAAQHLNSGAYEQWAEHLSIALSVWHGSSEWISAQRANLRATRPADLIDAVVNPRNARFSISAAWFAMLYAESGQIEIALDCLESALEQRSGALVYLNAIPLWDRLRSDRRFQQLLRQMRLA